MATTYKVVYKNHCTPQEQISSGGRFFLDSDCGRKLTGTCETSATLTATGTWTTGATITTDAVAVESGAMDFVFIKNTGSTDLLITLNNSDYFMKLSEGESFTSEITTDADVRVKTKGLGSSTTIDYFSVT